MIIKNSEDDLKLLNSKIARRGQKATWEGWTIKVFRADPRAAYAYKQNEYGERPVFFEGSYGWERKVEPNSEGIWLV